MSDDIEFTGDQAGIDRREIIKRGAILGGVVWAAPVIQSIGIPAFAATPTPVTTPTPEAEPWSFLAAVLTCHDNGGSKTIRVKYNYDNGGWESNPGPPQGHPHCNPEGYEDADEARHGGELGLRITILENGTWEFFIPDEITDNGHTCTVSDSVAFSGSSDGFLCEGPDGPGSDCTKDGVEGTCYLFTRPS